MILSHKHKFIFIKTTKTASTSIEIALSAICGDDDIITAISAEDEHIRQSLGFRGPQNHLAPLRDYRPGDVMYWLRSGRRKAKFFNHMSAQKLVDIFGEALFSDYFTFCFERNPWDKFLSKFFWEQRFNPELTLEKFIQPAEAERLRRGAYELYTIDGKIAVDRIYRYEFLEEDLADAFRRLRVNATPKLPDAKRNWRTDKRNYREILNHDQAARIKELFATEIELFDYEF